MVFPRFNPNSFWSLQAASDILGSRCVAPPLGLITVAALLPKDWDIRLINCNAEALTNSDIDWGDVVMTGGMLPQRSNCLDLIKRCQSRGKPVIVGGPDVTSSPDAYQAADMLFLGEAEGAIDMLVDAWNGGARTGRFKTPKFSVDVKTSPIPRFDLLKFDHYMYIGVQFSRGCPFNCEFCDIIELYGRVPRSKSNEQMLAELETLYRAGYRGHVDFVDDNLVGNKKALRLFLPALEIWQRERGYPFQFSTEASINLADDVPLMKMMSEVNFFALFVGIESPDTETLIMTQKKQNTRRSLKDSIHRIYDAGMLVTAGFIVGFDTEEDRVAAGMIDCIEDTAIPVCMVGLLTALPGTQLTRRLESERRLRELDAETAVDQCTGGLNFETLRPRRDVLSDYRTILQQAYDPIHFFQRVRRLGRVLRRPDLAVGKIQGAKNPFDALTQKMAMWRYRIRDYRALWRLLWCMTVRRPDLRPYFWSTFVDCARHNLAALESILTMMALYLHLGAFSRTVIAELDRQIAIEDAREREIGFVRSRALV
jgi:radical SAM superfamily enzyme YgiQ (UPF0313 family)